MNGSRIFTRALSAVLETILFIKEGSDGEQMIFPYIFSGGPPVSISRRSVANFRRGTSHIIVRRALSGKGLVWISSPYKLHF